MITSWTRKLIAAVLLTLLVAGCTMSFTYNHLDWLIPWYVDDYVDLSRQQRQLLQGQLGPVLQWHREEELQQYLEFLDRIEADLAGTVTATQVHNWADEIIDAIERVEENMVSVALEFGATLSDEQLAEFMESVWEEHREYEEEFLERTDQEYVEETAENLEDSLERLTGRLSDRQNTILLRAAESVQRFDAVWLDDHEKWLNTLGPLLNREPGWENAVKEAYANRKLRQSPEYTDLLEFNMNVVSEAIAEVLNSLEERQQKHLFAEIDDLRSLIQRLLAQRQDPVVN